MKKDTILKSNLGDSDNQKGEPRVFPGSCFATSKNELSGTEDLRKSVGNYYEQIQTPQQGRSPNNGLPF